jgi:hypothetical protein
MSLAASSTNHGTRRREKKRAKEESKGRANV